MKTQHTVLFMIVAVVATGLGTYNIAPLSAEVSNSNIGDEAGIFGHITLTATDENGEIFAFIQTDNTVLDEGDDCMIERVFGVKDSGTSNCSGAAAVFENLHIGSGGISGAPAETVTVAPVTCAGGTQSVAGTLATTSASSGGASTVVITATFANVNANIDEAAVSDSTTCAAGNQLAYQTFTEIVLGASDSLTIDWTITIDGATS